MDVQPQVFFDSNALPKELEGQTLLERREAMLPLVRASEPLSPGELALRFARMAAAGGDVGRVDFERTIGTNDLVGMEFLHAGLRASRPVARLLLPDGGFATGCLVGPRLLLTNAHVFPDANAAEGALAEFGYELDADRRTQPTERFTLLPDELFIAGSASDPRGLDFALVAVASDNEHGAALGAWGWLRLDGRPGKINEGEWITIIQHPAGEPKQIALRENRLLSKDDELGTLIYVTDTAPGSSGAPCFNDQWQVVALHSRGVPEMTKDGLVVLTGGRAPVPRAALRQRNDLRDSDIKWVANLGVRTSRIVAALRASAERDTPLLHALLADGAAQQGRPFGGLAPIANAAPTKVGGTQALAEALAAQLGGSFISAEEARRRVPGAPRRRAFGTGYQPDFLGGDAPVPFPTPTRKALEFGPVAINRDTQGALLPYQHFSVMMCAERRLAFATGVNIRGDKWIALERGRDKWSFDPRLPENEQAGEWLYAQEGAVALGEASGNFFDRGHLVRRADPCWGTPETAKLANDDTFHWTNCSPQHWSFNRGGTLWNGLEEYILTNTDSEDIRCTVFNGPVFRHNDVIHRGMAIPAEYWKLVAVLDRQGRLCCSAYTISQARMLQAIDFEALPVGQFRSFQRPVTALERRTGLDFGQVVRDACVVQARGGVRPEEATGPEAEALLLRSFGDILS